MWKSNGEVGLEKEGVRPTVGALVNFMCQLDWATKCSDIWSNVTLDVSVRVYLEEFNI